jgi:hypothetical protein
MDDQPRRVAATSRGTITRVAQTPSRACQRPHGVESHRR